MKDLANHKHPKKLHQHFIPCKVTKKRATLLHHGNYMNWSIENDVEKSKQLYRRRKNLDDLV